MTQIEIKDTKNIALHVGQQGICSAAVGPLAPVFRNQNPNQIYLEVKTFLTSQLLI